MKCIRKGIRGKTLIAVALAGMTAFSMTACSKKQASGTAAGGKSQLARITVEVFDRGTDGGKSDPTKNNWTDWIQQKVLEDENIEVTFVRVSRWEEIAALNNLMAAGNPPDVCLTYSAELVGNFRDLGGLYDMSPHIDTLLVDLKQFLGPDLAIPGRDFIQRNQDPTTGQVFSIPAKRMNTAQRNIFIRKDWLDKLGLPLPTTKEEFYNALAAFKEQDPGGVGKNRVIPFSMTTDVVWTGGNIIIPFMDPNISPKELWINTVIDRPFLVPGYKEGVRFLNKMYNDGLIDRDFPLYKSEEEMTNLLKSGMIGSICHNWDQIYRESAALLSDLQKNVPGADMVPVDCIESSDRITHKSAYDMAGLNYFIPASCKNPEAALRYINWLARFENYHFLQVGPESIVHDIVDGIPKIKNGEGLWIQNSAQNIDYTIIMNGLDLGDPDLTARALANAYPWPADVIANAYTISMRNAKPGPIIPVTLSAAGPVTQTLVDKGNSLLIGAVTTSPGNFDKVWDEGIADWLASGAEAVRQERTEKYFQP
ncbi:MAG: extracellular solute-binding protein [Treponema sp.]|jgi:putative aldouronate transport system substrate-binding protein|nr:extracellular solute-binding protein [Treponema sp.]